MRLSRIKSGNAERLYIIKSTYDPKTKKRSSVIVKKLGTEKEICAREGVDDANAWAKAYLEKLNALDENQKKAILVPFCPTKQIRPDKTRTYRIGQLFIDKVSAECGLCNITKKIAKKYSFEYDIERIVKDLVSSRILFPASKKSAFKSCMGYIEKPNYELHDIYRTLSVIAKHSDDIQAALYKGSLALGRRQTNILYYDCTNFFFEIEKADENGDRQYGISKQNKPNPLVQMGLFMDADGIPLAYTLGPGNQNEQETLCPLERQILKDFGLSRFICCTDAGLSSSKNRRFNTEGERAYITATSVKKLKANIKTWALDKTGWKIQGYDKEFDLDDCEKDDYVGFYNTIFYKERMVKGDTDDALEEKLVVTFSFKYREYLRSVRQRQIERAQKKIALGAKSVERHRPNDPSRFVMSTAFTDNGETANNKVVQLDKEKIEKESQYDGFYAVYTSLVDEKDISHVLKINSGRWEIEECFRIMKTEFSSRPVYLSRKERIQAHFLICFIALLIYRLLEKKLDYRYTCSQIIDTLRNMNMLEIEGQGYIPEYTRTEITDALHDVCGFRTDFEIVTNKKMRSIIAASKSKKVYTH